MTVKKRGRPKGSKNAPKADAPVRLKSDRQTKMAIKVGAEYWVVEVRGDQRLDHRIAIEAARLRGPVSIHPTLAEAAEVAYPQMPLPPRGRAA